MVIEILYSDICNLYGDRGNILFLKENLSNSTIVETRVNEVPYFVNHNVDMLYMGSASEAKQSMIIDRLKPYKDRIIELINQDKMFLLTGNSLEIFAKNIYEKGIVINTGLAILDVEVERNYQKRVNSIFKGKYQDLTILGFQSQFDSYKSNMEPLFEMEYGINSFSKKHFEGVKYKNLIATTLLGPLLILNPEFSLKILNMTELKYQSQLFSAYNKRLEDFNRLIERGKK